MEDPDDRAATSALALNTLTKLAVDVSNTFNCASHGFDINALPVSSAYAVFHAALSLANSGNESMSRVSNDWLRDIETLRVTLWHYSQRWKIAGIQNSFRQR